MSNEEVVSEAPKHITLNAWFNHEGKVFQPGTYVVSARQHKDLTESMQRRDLREKKVRDERDARQNIYMANLRKGHVAQAPVQPGMSAEDVATLVKESVAAEIAAARAQWEAEKEASVVTTEAPTERKISLSTQK